MQARRTSVPVNNHKIGWVNGLLIILLVVLPTVFGWFGKTAEMGILIVACSIALCFANLNKIQSFKGAGFEAQMREAVEEAVEEAYATVEAMQTLARPLVRTNMANIAYSGRWFGIGREQEHELMKELSTLTETLEMKSDPEIQSMERDFYNLNAVDHIRFLTDVMRVAHIKNEAVTQNLEALMVRTDDYVPPSGSTVRRALAELTTEQKALLEPYVQDYEHYIREHSFRRPEAVSQSDLTSLSEALNQAEPTS